MRNPEDNPPELLNPQLHSLLKKIVQTALQFYLTPFQREFLAVHIYFNTRIRRHSLCLTFPGGANSFDPDLIAYVARVIDVWQTRAGLIPPWYQDLQLPLHGRVHTREEAHAFWQEAHFTLSTAFTALSFKEPQPSVPRSILILEKQHPDYLPLPPFLKGFYWWVVYACIQPACDTLEIPPSANRSSWDFLAQECLT